MLSSLYDKIISNKKAISILFYLLVLTFPFGSSILHISLGFFTLYPFLFLLAFLFLIGLPKYKIIRHKIEKYAIWLMCFWLVYALISCFFIKSFSDALIDIRSIIVMLMVTYVLIWIKNFFGIKWFIQKIDLLFKIIFFFLLAVAIFEINTGIHFAGYFTHQLIKFPIGNVTYSPVFLYDNPNNFFVFLILVGSIALIADAFIKRSKMFFGVFLMSIFYISFVSSVRTGEIMGYFISCLILIYFLIQLKSKLFIKKYRLQLYASGSVIALFIISVISLPLYFGPIWQPKQQENVQLTKNKKLKNVNELSTLIDMKYVPLLNKEVLDNHFDSKKIRLALFINGWYMLKNSHYLGVGPGQYRYLSRIDKKKYYTKTNIGPHCWFVEILSEYGVIIFLAYLLLIAWSAAMILRFYKKDNYAAAVVLVAGIVFLLSGILPSDFIVLNINWIFVAIFIAIISDLKNLNDKVTQA